jgi:hypothetical protein
LLVNFSCFSFAFPNVYSDLRLFPKKILLIGNSVKMLLILSKFTDFFIIFKIKYFFPGSRPCSVFYDEIQETGQQLTNPEVQQATSEVDGYLTPRQVTEGISVAGTSDTATNYVNVLNHTEGEDVYHYIWVDGKKM